MSSFFVIDSAICLLLALLMVGFCVDFILNMFESCF